MGSLKPHPGPKLYMGRALNERGEYSPKVWMGSLKPHPGPKLYMGRVLSERDGLTGEGRSDGDGDYEDDFDYGGWPQDRYVGALNERGDYSPKVWMGSLKPHPGPKVWMGSLKPHPGPKLYMG